MILTDDGVPHAFKLTWYYELPVGRGKRFGTNINPWRERRHRQLGVLGHRQVAGA